jgi:hypothetical protein
MNPKKNNQNIRPPKPENPFRVPEGYFEDVQNRVMERIRTGRKIYLQPYLTLAAAISGVALVVYIVLQSVMGSRAGDDNAYDIATLDRAGVIQDESILAEAYNVEDEATAYSEWDEEAITFLASNEVDLLNLLDNN